MFVNGDVPVLMMPVPVALVVTDELEVLLTGEIELVLWMDETVDVKEMVAVIVDVHSSPYGPQGVVVLGVGVPQVKGVVVLV